jgi:hypothetical protein
MLNRALNGALMPQRYKTKVYTTFVGKINMSSVAPAEPQINLLFLANSVLLPWATYSGLGENARLEAVSDSVIWDHNTAMPIGLSQILGQNAIYENFRVYASKISMRVISGNTNDQIAFVIYPIASAGTPGVNFQRLIENPLRSGPKIIDYYGTAHFNTLTNYKTISSIVGVHPNAVRDAVEYAGNYNSQPAALVRWGVSIYNTLFLDFTDDIPIEIKLTYWTEFYNINDRSMKITDP